ncbi:hypothetical protein D3C78_1037810 [compost metagenome]
MKIKIVHLIVAIRLPAGWHKQIIPAARIRAVQKEGLLDLLDTRMVLEFPIAIQ